MPETLIPPTRQAAGGLGRWIATAGRWIQRNFTRENIVQGLKTFASVGPLTVLIWVYAEREGIRPQKDVSIAIEVRSNDPRRIVSLQKPYPDKVVVADLAGPSGTLDSLVDRLQRHSGDEPSVQIFADATLTTGMVHEIDAAQALSNNPMFQGITVSNCQPAKLEVLVDEVEERDLEVQPPPGITNLVGPPVFTPRSVKVRGPKESLEELDKAHKLVAIADLGAFDAMNVPGPHNFPVVRIKPLDDPSVVFTPPNVEAAVSVRESDVAGTIRSVPIWVSGPPALLARYHVELVNPSNGVLTNVKVIGPKDKIDLVNQPDFAKPHAVLEIRDEDESSSGKLLQRAVRFDLGDLGLRVNDEISQHPVDFRLVDLKTTE